MTREEPNRPALAIEGCGEIAGDLRRPAARIEEHPHRHRLSHEGVLGYAYIAVLKASSKSRSKNAWTASEQRRRLRGVHLTRKAIHL